MRSLRSLGAVFVLILLLFLAQEPAQAQDDARVLPRGVVRLHLGGAFTIFDSRFGRPAADATSEREPLGTAFPGILRDSSFVPLQVLQSNLNQLFEGTDTLGSPFRAGPENLALTVAGLRTAADVRVVPFGLEAGVLPRVSIGVRSALVRTRLEVRSLGIVGGTVGINPDPAYNRALFAAVDSVVAGNLSALAGTTLLPTRDSELGRALQARVRAATGGRELRLPDTPLDAIGVQGLGAALPGTGRFGGDEEQWRLGDSEISARVQLLNSAPGFPYPRDERRFGARAAVEAGFRVPTGQVADTGYLVLPIPEQGLGGPFVFLAGDIFAAPRVWATAAVRWESLGEVEFDHRTSSSDAPGFPPSLTTSRVRWDPGSRIAVDLVPRFRLADELTLFGMYRNLRWQGESYTVVEGTLPIGEQEITRTAQQWGGGAEFSTLPAYFAGRRTLPFEATILFRQTFAGSAGAEAMRTLEIRASVYQPLWGRRPTTE